MPDLITIQVEIEDGVTESVRLTDLGNSTYRVEDQPLMCESIIVFDEIEGELDTNGCLRNVRVVKKSGWKSQHFLLSQEFIGRLSSIQRNIEKAGGFWDLAMGGIFIVSLPPGCSYEPAKDLKIE